MTYCERELPKYLCHKTVWALKIERIDGLTIYPADEGYAPFGVPLEYMDKHKPQAGGYYVLYDGGYASFSPADAFNGGYVQLGQGGSEIPKLLEFYGVSTAQELVGEMQAHIRQLVAKVSDLSPEPHKISKVREG